MKPQLSLAVLISESPKGRPRLERPPRLEAAAQPQLGTISRAVALGWIVRVIAGELA